MTMDVHTSCKRRKRQPPPAFLPKQLFNSQPDLRAFQQMDMIEGEYAAPPSRMSLWYYNDDADPGDTDVKIRSPGGMTLIVNDIAQGSNIQFNRIVTDIEYDSGTRLTSIYTSDNVKYVAQRVIVTCPLAVLQADTIGFVPPMPLTWQNALSRRSTGLLDGVVLQFNAKFWDSTTRIARVTTPAGDYQEMYNAQLFVDGDLPVLQLYLSTGFAEVR